MKKRVTRRNSKGQIWVETVIYTLIAFAMIGLALAFIKPKIDEIQDEAIIEQSISVLEEMNTVIEDLSLKDAGNQRILDVGLKEGTLTIEGGQDELSFVLEGEYAYSEPGSLITIGNINVYTEELGELYIITLNKSYSSYDLKTGDGAEDIDLVLSPSSNSYRILVSRLNDNSNNEAVINFEVIN